MSSYVSQANFSEEIEASPSHQADGMPLPPLPKVVSLFSGAGGLDLGFTKLGFPLVCAIDVSEAAIRTHRRNFQQTFSLAADLEELGHEGVLGLLEDHLAPEESIAVIGGPPCQGFSRANAASRPDDPRNRLTQLYLDIVRALQEVYSVEFILFENVLGIKDTKHKIVFESILSEFTAMGFAADVTVYSALDFGVPQTRSRVIISGFKDSAVKSKFKPRKVPRSNKLTVRNAIEGLPEPAYFQRGLDKAEIPYHENHWTMRPVSKKFSLPGGARSSGRSFRRLDWDKPSLTVAYGNREIHVHPEGHRRLSIYEAMILQGFPYDFVLEGTLSEQVDQVSNAVPPPLAQALAIAIQEAFYSCASVPRPEQLESTSPSELDLFIPVVPS